jgi:hypothetical protein
LLSILVNFIVNGWVIGLWVAGKLRAAAIPRWLLIVNGLFFIIQLALLILNRT